MTSSIPFRSRREIRCTPSDIARLSRSLVPLFMLAILASTPWLYGDEAINRLVRLVGRDAGLCVEIPRLDQTVTAFEHGEFFQRLQQSQIYSEWQAGNDFRQAKGVVNAIEKFTGKPFRQFFHDVFGSAVVVAVYPGPGSRMTAVLLTETTSRETLDAVIEGWNKAEPQQTHEYHFAGHTYYKRTCEAQEKPGEATLFYAKLDRTLLLSDREERVRRSLELSGHSETHDCLLDLPAYQEAFRSLQHESAARAYINPRAWDAVLGLPQTASPEAGNAGIGGPGPLGTGAAPTGSAVARAIAAAWQRCEWVALGLQTDRGIVIEAVARYSTAGLSDAARQFIKSMSGSAEFLRFAPHDALIVLAGREAFGILLRNSLPLDSKGPDSGAWESFRQVSRGLLLGWDLFDDVLPAFRNNWGGYVVPKHNSKPEQLPFDGLIAVELPPPEAKADASQAAGQRVGEKSADSPAARQRPPLREAIDNGMNTGLNFVAAYLNVNSPGKPAVVHTEFTHGTRIRWIESSCPYRAALGLTHRFLVVATDPQAIRDFAAAETARRNADSAVVPPGIRSLATRYFPSENQLLYVNTAALRQFLKEHGPQLIEQAVRCRSLDPDRAKKTLTRFLDVARLFDSVFAAGRLGDGSVRIVIGGVVNGPSPAQAANRSFTDGALLSRGSAKSGKAE